MKHVWKGLVLGVAGALTAIGVAGPVSAQSDLGGVSTLGDLESLEGLESAVSRTVSIDFENLDPSAIVDEEGNVTLEDSIVTSYSVYDFDSEDNAGTAFETAEEEFNAELEEGTDGSLSMESFEPDDVGDNALGFHGTGTDEMFGELHAAGVLVQDGELLILVVTVGVGDDYDSQQVATDSVKEIADNEAGDEDSVEFNEDGTSTGGLWDLMPEPVEDDTLVTQDDILFPEDDSATADASPEAAEEEAA